MYFKKDIQWFVIEYGIYFTIKTGLSIQTWDIYFTNIYKFCREHWSFLSYDFKPFLFLKLKHLLIWKIK